MTVQELKDKLTQKESERVQFVSDSQDVAPINEMFGMDYDSFFVVVGDGDYDKVFGMYGIVPYFTRTVYEVRQ